MTIQGVGVGVGGDEKRVLSACLQRIDPMTTNGGAIIARMPEPLAANAVRLSNIGRGVLYTRYQDSYAHLDFAPGEREVNRTKEARERTEKNLDETWELAKTLIPAEAESLTINYTHIYIAYTYRDTAGEVQTRMLGETDIQGNPRLRDLMMQIREDSKVIWKKVALGSEFGTTANRSLDGNKPFEIITEDWKKKRGNFNQDDFDLLQEIIKERNGNIDESFAGMVGIKAEIKALQQGVADLKRRREGLIEDPNRFNALKKAEKSRAQQSLQDLQKLEAMLQSMDNYPVYWAAAILGNRSAPTDQEGRFLLADEITSGVQMALYRKLLVNDRSWLKKKFFNDETGSLGPFIRNYALDSGDLIMHNKLELLARMHGTDRSMKGISTEELAMYLWMRPPEFDAAEAIGSLGIAFDNETRDALVDVIKHTHNQAEEARKAAQGLGGVTFLDRVDKMKRNPVLKALAEQ